MRTRKFRRQIIPTMFLLFVVSQFPTTQAQNTPNIPLTDRIRLAEAFKLGETLSDKIWKGWSKAPFAVLLITPDYEFLVRHPKPSSDFQLIGHDTLLKSDVYFRKRVFQKDFLATFPAVGGVSTIVVGQAENTNAKTSTPWVVTVLHEHFHQMQDSYPNMNVEIESLNLSRGDKDGMWMLNYPFPYGSTKIDDLVTVLAKSLADAVESSKTEVPLKLSDFFDLRSQLQTMLNSDDYKYFSFQLWKEGIARYTEYHVAKQAASTHKPSTEFEQLKDYTSFEETAGSILKNILTELRNLPLANYKRVAFYYLGAGEGLLLDRLNPGWHRRYFEEKFFLEKYRK